MRTVTRRGWAAVLLLALLPLAACSGSSSDEGVVQVALDDRDDPVTISGDDLDGQPIDVADYRGKPVVLVVWGSWCAPCNAEAADVVAVADELGDRAQFVGLDIRDKSTDDAKAYVRAYDVPYPSVYSPDSAALVGFPGRLTPRSVPAFAVLDAQGRVAASILGPLPSKLTLTELVEDVEKETAASGSDGTRHG